MITVAMSKLIFKEPFFANLLLNMTRTYTTQIPTVGVNVTDNVNLYINPYFWESLTIDEQVDILKHECISGNMLIKTNRGLLKIKDIVENKLDVKVLSLSKKGNLEYKDIIQYSKKNLKDYPNKKWVSLKYSSSPFLYSTIKCTNDHRIAFVENPLSSDVKFIKAENSLNVYSIRNVDEKRILNKERAAFNKEQLEVIIGCLLGDSSISAQGQFKSSGSLKYSDYTSYKKQILGGKIKKAYSGYRDEMSNLILEHGVTEQSKYLHDLFYVNGKKIVKNIINMITPVSLAFWFMDDGSWDGYGSSFLHTEGFTYEDQELLVNTLKNKFNLNAEIHKRSSKELYNLKFKKADTEKLFALIAPYMHNSMKHKISEKYHELFGMIKIDNKHLPYSIKKIVEVKSLSTSETGLYDIAVKDNHNFFANNTLVHNCYHVINNHFSRFADLEPQIYEEKKKTIQDKVKDMTQAGVLNRAGDYAINEYLPNLPKKMYLFDEHGNKVIDPKTGEALEGSPCLVNDLKKQLKNPKIENKQTTEYYYGYLKEEQKKQQKNGQGQGDGQGMTIDDHTIWNTGEDPEYVTEKVKQTVNKAVEATGGRESGNLPGDVIEAIERLNHKPKNWKNELQRFVSKMSEIVLESSRKVRNRRYGILYPGTKVYPKLTLGVVIDTSGSITNEELTQFMAEIDHIHKNNVKVIVLECDTKVNAEYEFDPRKEVKVSGRGGTLFQPGLDRCDKLDVDAIFYMTDGQNFDTDLKKPKAPVLWCVLKNFKMNCKFGSFTQIEIKKKSKAS